jgi:hypothetical protein
MTPIPIDAGTIDLRQNASAEYGLSFSGRRRWSGMTIAKFFPCRFLCSTGFMLHCAARRKRRATDSAAAAR